MAKLFMLLVGCSPQARHIEQHDVFVGIGEHIKDLLPDVKAFWTEAGTSLHIDAWREVTLVNGHSITVMDTPGHQSETQLYFINLGGYRPNEFEEFHYKMLVAAPDKASAIKQSKQTAFFKHTGFKGASAHIDDKYGVDVDDVFTIAEILPKLYKSRYSLIIEQAPANAPDDVVHLGYYRLDKVDSWAPSSEPGVS